MFAKISQLQEKATHASVQVLEIVKQRNVAHQIIKIIIMNKEKNRKKSKIKIRTQSNHVPCFS